MLNFPLRLINGGVGLVIHPIQGLSRHAYALATHRAIAFPDVLREPRRLTSIEEASRINDMEREAIIKAYEKLLKLSSTRRTWRREGKKVVLVPNKEERQWQREGKDLKRVYKAGDLPRAETDEALAST